MASPQATYEDEPLGVSASAGGAGSALFWALLDATLLVLSFALAAGMLVQLGPLQSIAWLLCYALVFLLIGVRSSHLLPVFMRNGAVLAFPLIATLSAAWSYSPGASFYAAFQLLVTILMGVYLGFRFSLGVILKAFAVLIAIAAALSIVHGFTGVFPWPTHSASGGLAGIFQHKNMLGNRSLYGAVIIAALFLLYRDEVGWTSRPVLFLAFGICCIGLLLALSATALLQLPILVGGVLVLSARRVPKLVALLALATVVLSVSLGPVFLAAAGIDPIETIFDALGKDSTLTGRTYLWDIALGVQADHPFLGVGYRAFWMASEFATGRALTHAAGARDALGFHNFALDALVSVGIIGLLALLIWFVTAVYRLWALYRLRMNPMPAAGLMLVLGMFVTGMLTTSLSRGHDISFLLLAALTVAAGEDLRRSRRQPRER